MYAVIDIGSNTIRLTAYKGDTQKFRVIFSSKATTQLYSLLEDGKLSQEGIDRICDILMDFQTTLQNMKIHQIGVFATATLRKSSNSQQVLEEIFRCTGLSVEILSGEEEARLGFVGAMHCAQAEEGVLVDIGGGSTEVTTYANRTIRTVTSMPIGCLALYKDYVKKILPTPKEVRNLRQKIGEWLDQVGIPQQEAAYLCGMGGTIRAALKLNNDLFSMPEKNLSFSADHLEYICNTLLEKDATARSIILKICPERVHTLLPGLLILQELIHRYQVQTITISRYGVREGYLIDRLLTAPGVGNTLLVQGGE